MIYRLTQDIGGLYEGSCVSENDYMRVGFHNKCLFEPISEEEVNSMIKYNDKEFCMDNSIDFLLFYNDRELNRFLNKISNDSR